MDSLTIEKILRTAEQHFATHGFFASSVRQITREAGVNVAAVHYHFGSKESLFVAVLNRSIVPFAQSVWQGLQQEQANKSVLQVEDVVDIFIHACFDLINQREQGAALFSKLFSRLMLDEYRIFREALVADNQHLADFLLNVFQAALPSLTVEAVRWRMHLALSTLFNAFAGNDVVKALMPAVVVNARDPIQVARYVKPFVVAGLKAPF